MASIQGQRGLRFALHACCGAAVAMVLSSSASAASLSAKDCQIIAKAMGFLDPAPPGGVIAVVYSDAASKADADEIVTSFGSGLASSGGSVTAKAVDAGALGGGAGFIAMILASGAATDAVGAAAKSHRIPCITASNALVASGTCTMAIQSQPKVSIIVNHAAAVAGGIGFASAFAMLIHEI